MTTEATALISRPVIDTSHGRQLGRVKDAVFDPEQQVFLGLLVEARPGGDMFLQRERIRAFGGDAVTVESESSLTPLVAEPRARAVVESGVHLRGSPVVTEEGEKLGSLDHIALNDDGSIACYSVSSGFLSLGDRIDILPSRVKTIGVDAIVVAPDVDVDGREPSWSTPPGTDPNKETIVSEPDSQPGNLIDEETGRG